MLFLQRRWNVRLLLPLLLLLVACGSAPPATSPPAPTQATAAITVPAATAPVASASSVAPTAAASTSTQKTRIIEQSATFPRKIEALNGVITVAQKPQRVMTLSVGYDEMTLALVDKSRIAAISQYTADPTISNVADQVAGIPIYGKGAEQVIAAKPDLVVADRFTDKDLVRQVQAAGVTVAVTDLVDAYDGFVGSIRVLAYLYGEDARGDALIRDINDRLARIDAVVAKHAGEPKPHILLLQGNAYVAGAGSNMDGIIRRAGGINVAAESGISGTKQISLESIIAMNPDTIVIPGSPEKDPKSFAQVTANPALAAVPAVVNKRVFGVTDAYLFTLSHWNVRAMEELARLLYPNG
jgi:iron complex transport system substrate-binding protein